MFKLYKTYNKVKDVFVKPKLKFIIKFHDGYRNKIRICKKNTYYYINNCVQYPIAKKGDIKSDGTIYEYDTFGISYHKLPTKDYCYWKRSIRQKLRKYGLGWIKPIFILPSFLTFRITNFDVQYKWKYGSIRFEYPPEFSITLFGIRFIWVLKYEEAHYDDSEDFYWESLLSYLYQPQCNQDIKDTLFFCGKWTVYKPFKHSIFQLRADHLKNKYHSEYNKAVELYNKYEFKKTIK